MDDTLTIFRLIAPEFKDIPDETVMAWITLTEPFVSKRRFRKLYHQALALLTAHRMKLAGVSVVSGDDPLADVGNIGIAGLMRVGSFSEGETSIGFNTNYTQFADINAELSLTPYGIQYLTILRLIMSIVSAGEPIGRP
jgi:hypothetical protein